MGMKVNYQETLKKIGLELKQCIFIGSTKLMNIIIIRGSQSSLSVTHKEISKKNECFSLGYMDG